MGNYLKDVRDQYENYPYPYRNPADEKSRLVTSIMENASYLSHYGFGGKLELNDKKFLIAGGGTGDAAIYLAEQLRHTNSTITYVDISSTSMEIAQKRALIRELTNIEWHQASILELSTMNLGKFDYINCTGVLHHLEQPEAGLESLCEVLAPDGAMGIMVYAKYGRTGVYQMQELMRFINENTTDSQKKVENTKSILRNLPSSNWFAFTHKQFSTDIKAYGDIGIYDLFLHSQDRSYSVPELYEFLDTCGLHLISFIGDKCGAASVYTPNLHLQDEDILSEINKLPIKKQQAIAEILYGRIIKHTFYVSPREPDVAQPTDLDNVVCFIEGSINGNDLYNHMNLPNGQLQDVTISSASSNTMKLSLNRQQAEIIRHIDNQKTIAEILDITEKHFNGEFSKEVLLSLFVELYQPLCNEHMVTLRHKSIPSYKNASALQDRICKIYKTENKNRTSIT